MKLLGMIICTIFGHKWTHWENMKFISGRERHCPRCMLHEADEADGTSTYAWMRDSSKGGWTPAKPLRKR